MTDSVARSATRLTRSRAKSFYLASLFLPRNVRRNVHVIYAYYRTIDDLVDEPPSNMSRVDILRELQRWEDGLVCGSRSPEPLLQAVIDIADRHKIPAKDLTMVIDGARFDLDCGRCNTLADLVQYSVLVAGSVGMVMARLLGAREAPDLQAACDLGVAMQLTNILRDVDEDLAVGRIYLPADLMRRRHCDYRDLEARALTPPLKHVLSDLLHEARHHYRLGSEGIARLDPSVRFSIALAASLYERILDKIERNGFDVFAGRAHLGTMEKWTLAMPAYLRYRYAARR